jgi:hypothetical protein
MQSEGFGIQRRLEESVFGLAADIDSNAASSGM